MNDYAYLSLAQAAEYIRNKEISPVEYTEALIDRLGCAPRSSTERS